VLGVRIPVKYVSYFTIWIASPEITKCEWLGWQPFCSNLVNFENFHFLAIARWLVDGLAHPLSSLLHSFQAANSQYTAAFTMTTQDSSQYIVITLAPCQYSRHIRSKSSFLEYDRWIRPWSSFTSVFCVTLLAKIGAWDPLRPSLSICKGCSAGG